MSDLSLSYSYERMNGFFEKFHVVGAPFDAVFHRFTGVEHGFPHDHPFPFQSHVLKGSYVEEIYTLDGKVTRVTRKAGDCFQVPAGRIHKIVELPEGECWTLMLPGEREQVSGFYEFQDGGKILHRRWNETTWKEISGSDG